MKTKSKSASRKASAKSLGRVVWDVSMSLDGFAAGPNDSPDLGMGKNGDRLFDWYFKGETPSTLAESFELSREDARLFDKELRTIGAIVAGRRT